MTTKKVSKAAKKIKKSNAKFAKMTKEQKAVMIAKDVLAQIEAGSIKPTRGTYFWLSKKNNRKIKKEDNKKDVRDILKEIPTCDVCAIGSVFVSAAKIFDKMPAEKWLGGMDDLYYEGGFNVSDCFKDDVLMIDALEQYFPEDSLRDMEDYFEMYSGKLGFSAKKGLKTIMQNIIDNNGVYVPVF